MHIQKGDTEAEILERGAYLYSFKVNSRDVLLEGRERQTRGGMALLIPFANRIKGGEYCWRGKKYELPKNSEGNAIHGLVRDKVWDIESLKNDEVTLSLYLKDQGYPSPLFIKVRYLLDSSSLTTAISIKNEGSDAPLVVGAHPYFIVRGNWRIFPDRAKRLIMKDKIPTGEMEDFTITQREYDDCFLLKGNVTLFSEYSKVTIEKENMDFVQIYTGQPSAVAVEPMSGAPDAFHNEIGLATLKEGETMDFTFRISVRL
ncbi:aldose 1-epimerase [Acidianus sp. HS-5]|uniref:aldose 1-epimerase n=1 Tax=Acidianus sp. HS-5 TaxID=2886040 RepID=UPI001F2DF935|nr:aldose 1-epimerase [Acidianus sp. HS-5]BDC17783.1 aldose epimerase [Acidianus sp. HS-5]